MRMLIFSAAIAVIAQFGSAYSNAESEFLGQYRLISGNGLNWTEVVEFPSHLNFYYELRTLNYGTNTDYRWLPGTEFWIYMGDCKDSVCNGDHPKIYEGIVLPDTPNTMEKLIGPIDPNLVIGNNGFVNAAALKNNCNELVSNDPDAVFSTHTLSREIYFTIRLYGPLKRTNFNNPVSSTYETADEKYYFTADAKVFCESFGNNPGPIEGEELKVFLATSSNVVSNPTLAVECPKTRATVRLKTNRAGNLPVLLHKKIGNAQEQIKEVTIESTLQADGSFLGRFEEWISVDQTQTVSIKAIEKDNPYITNDINLETNWEEISLVCSGVGGGGLQTTNNDDSGLPNTPKRNPALPPGVNNVQILPDHTGGGERPSSVQTTTPLLPNQTQPKREANLRSDGELVQGVSEKPGIQNNQRPTPVAPSIPRPVSPTIPSQTSPSPTSSSQTMPAQQPIRQPSPQTIQPINTPNQSQRVQDSNDRFANAQTSSQLNQTVPTLYQGSIGDQCSAVPGMRHQPNLVLKRGLTQVYVECKNSRIVEVMGKTVNPQWKQGDPVQARFR